jgi:hypothetical protein
MAAKKKPAITGLPQGIVDDLFKAGGKALVSTVRRDVRKAIKVDNSATNIIRKGSKQNWSKATGKSVDARQKAGTHFAKQAGIKPLKRTTQTQAQWEKEWDTYWRAVNKSGLSKALKEETAILNTKRAKAGRKPVAKNAGKISTRKIK